MLTVLLPEDLEVFAGKGNVELVFGDSGVEGRMLTVHHEQYHSKSENVDFLPFVLSSQVLLGGHVAVGTKGRLEHT